MYSILNSVKKIVGLDESYEAFDDQIIANINAVLATLYQIGVGPATPVIIEDATVTWEALTSNPEILAILPTYVGMQVRLMFDPPQSGPLIEVINKTIQQYEWRISVAVDHESKTDGGMITFV